MLAIMPSSVLYSRFHDLIRHNNNVIVCELNVCCIKSEYDGEKDLEGYSPRWGQYPQLTEACYIYCEPSHTSCDSRWQRNECKCILANEQM